MPTVRHLLQALTILGKAAPVRAQTGLLVVAYTSTALTPLPQLAAWIERVALARRAVTQ